jgi:hypothetical protein
MRLGLLLPLALSACIVRAPHDDEPEDTVDGPRRPFEDSLGTTSTATGTATGTATDTDTGLDTDCATTPVHVVRVSASPAATPWVPGGDVTVVARLENRGTTDFMAYPGVRVTTDSADVTTASDSQVLYGLFAGQALDLGFTFSASAGAAPGTVTFTAETTALHCDETGRCPPPCPVTTTLDLVAAGR